ncbi:MAG: hypothetical protein MHM6MM_003972 [Cercozoa sp. M6MM]
MSLTAREHALYMLRYSRWATKQLMLSLRQQLSAEQLSKEVVRVFPNEGSILNLLAHVAAGEKLWFSRVQFDRCTQEQLSPLWRASNDVQCGRFIDLFRRNNDTSLEVLDRIEKELYNLNAQWKAYVRDSDMGTLEYQDSSGSTMHIEIPRLLAHLCNHATHHRGQVTAAMSTFPNVTVPGIDLLYFRDDEEH